jgi:PAS domain S-box-containing protein
LRDISGIDRHHLNDAQRIAEVGSWELDLATGELNWSAETFRLFEIDPVRSPASYDAFLALVHPDDRSLLDATFNEAVTNRRPYDCTHRIRMPDGRMKWLRERGEMSYALEGAPRRAIGTVQDITAQKVAELALAASELRYRGLVEALADGVIAEDDDGAIVVFNAAAEELLGLRPEQAVGRRWADIHHPSTRVVASPCRDADGDGSGVDEHGPRSVVYSHPGGGQRYLEVRTFIGHASEPGFRTTIVRDRTPEHDAIVMQAFGAAQRAEVRHMAAVGALAAKVAHEFNNTLNAIVGQSELARLDARASGMSEARLDAIQESVMRGARIANEILGYARGGGAEFSTVNLAAIVREAVDLARSVLPGHIDLDVDIRDPDVWLLGSEPQIHQVISNLCRNSCQAIGEGSGVIRLSLGSIRAQRDPAARRRPGDLAWLSVEDTGPGIPNAILDRVFDPFFTTRSSDDGSGLGLAVVRGIVLAHGGSVHVENAAGAGARFVITLPLMSSPESAEHGDTVAPRAGPELPRVRVAAVDDSGSSLAATVDALRMAGAEVIGYRDPLKFLMQLSDADDAPDVLITDVRMPVLGGVDLAKRVRELRPGLPIIMVTGYAGPELRAEANRAGVATVLDKPLIPLRLIEAVAQVLTTGTTDSHAP